MNIHVPDNIRDKYPQMEFRGKPFDYKNRKVIKAVNHTINQHFTYSFEEDFFWFRDCEIPDWYVN